MGKIKRVGNIDSFTLHRSDVIELARFASFDGAVFKISTDLNNGQISSDNVEKFLGNAELPVELSQLSIFSFGGSRSVSMYFSLVDARIEVEGDDSLGNWVMMAYEAIMGRLNTRARRFRILRSVFTSKIFASLVIALPLIFIMKSMLTNSIWYFGVTVVSWSYLMITYIGWIFFPSASNRIIVKSRQWYIQHIDINTWALIVAVLSLIVAIIDTVAGIIS